jgi:hypothetical protein
MEVSMRDREIIHHQVDDGGMGTMLGMVVGALLVVAGIFYFAGHFTDGSEQTASAPAVSETTGSR